jgi:hypothetical protein
MSLFKRGKVWHYDFQCAGVRYRGSTRETSRQRATIAEARVLTGLLESGEKVGHYPKAPHINGKQGWVYYIQDSLTGKVKIGFASNMKSRVVSIQSSCPGELRILASERGTVRDEKAIHEKFKHCRYRGEWFNSYPDLMLHISMLGSEA